MIKAYEIREPKGFESLNVVERPRPEPGHGEVAIRVRAVSLNYRDLMVVSGGYMRGLPPNIIPCSDGAGDIIAVGPGVTDFAVGDRVAGCFFTGWACGPYSEAAGKTAQGGAVDGMLVEEKVLPTSGVVKIPDHLTFEEASTLPCAALTAWHALIEAGGLRPGQTVLTQGTGGVSLFAIQFARIAGARVISTSGRPEGLERAKALGASATVNYKATPEWGHAVRELADGLGVDHVVEVGGAGTLGQSFKAVKAGGQIALIGVLSGAGEVNPAPLLMRNVRLQGIYVGSKQMFESMNAAISHHGLRPVVDRIFTFDAVRDAYAHLKSGSHFGKIVIRVGTAEPIKTA